MFWRKPFRLQVNILTTCIEKNKFLKNATEHLPAQMPASQVLDSMLFPEQSFPPPSGAGFVQLRDRLCTPTPHDTLQDDHSSQELQPPSSKVVKIMK